VEAPSAADKWRAAIAAVSPPKSPQKKASGGGNAALAEAAQELGTVLGGRSFMVVVRPALARHLSDEEARTAMEEHARAETALACEAFGPGLGACVAGEMRSLTVRMPPRPLRCRLPRAPARSSQPARPLRSGGQARHALQRAVVLMPRLLQ
jgi:hypothetical protein